MAATRQAQATWIGELKSGSGTLQSKTTAALNNQAFTWASRTEVAGGKTSPEELIAAAHAGCFAMSIANELDAADIDPKKLEVFAAVTFAKVGEGFSISESNLEVRAWTGGASEADFQKAIKAAEANCPVSRALKATVKIAVSAKLEQ